MTSEGVLPAATFGLDARRLREGYWSDAYFVNTTRVLARTPRVRDRTVLLQVFQKDEDVVVCGMSEAIAVLQEGSVSYCAEGHVLADDPTEARCPRCGAAVHYPELAIRYLPDGATASSREPVLHVEGRYLHVAHLETVYLGALARGTRVATNVARAVRAARSSGTQKPIFFFPARHDNWRVQAADGYAAFVGARAAGYTIGVSTEAQASWWGASATGTMPHALIAVEGGDTVQAALDLAEALWAEHGPEARVIALVDYANDCVATSLAVARAFRERYGPGHLWGVRADTSETLLDHSLLEDPQLLGSERVTGVSPHLVVKLRRRLDEEGFGDVRVIASGGFTPERIRLFESSKLNAYGKVVPLDHPTDGTPVRVDGYGVGESLLAGSTAFTADVVKVDGRFESKVGRRFMPNERLIELRWSRRPS